MLTSLFGELRSIRAARKARSAQANTHHQTDPDPSEPNYGFAATAIMNRIAAEITETIDPELLVERHVRDLVVSGSPAQGIRDHFEATRADLSVASRQITLLDPSGLWASSVIKALSEASGKPVEKLHLREEGTLRTLAMIERTLLERHNEETLRIYHAEVRAKGYENENIPNALMERSHLTAVIVGAISPEEVDDLLCSLYRATQNNHWRCPTLLFMLPPNAVWISNKITMIDWPHRVRVQTINEALASASAVWNSLLSMWNRAKLIPALTPTATPSNLADDAAALGFPIKLADISKGSRLMSRSGLMGSSDAQKSALSIKAASQALRSMIDVEGLMGCAVVDADTGLILARQAADKHPFHLDLAAAQGAQVLRAHYQAAHDMGVARDTDEITTTGGGRHHLVRTSTRHPGLFLFALLDKTKANLALSRYKLMEAEHNLV
jgi:hypothetical protein